MADYGLLGALGEGLKAGLSSYQGERDYQEKKKQAELAKALEEKRRKQELAVKGFAEGPDGTIAKTPEQIEQETRELFLKGYLPKEGGLVKTPEKAHQEKMEALTKRADLLKSGYDIDESGPEPKLKAIPGYKPPEEKAFERLMMQDQLTRGRDLSKRQMEAQVPGFQLAGDNIPSTKDAETVKTQAASVQKIGDLIDSMKSKIAAKNKVNPILDQDYRNSLKNDFAALKIAWKNAAELGALSGPDVGLIEEANIDPTSIKADILGVKGVLDALESAKDRTHMGLLGEAKARGYLPSQVTPKNKPTEVFADESVKVINGVKYKKVPGGWEETK